MLRCAQTRSRKRRQQKACETTPVRVKKHRRELEADALTSPAFREALLQTSALLSSADKKKRKQEPTASNPQGHSTASAASVQSACSACIPGLTRDDLQRKVTGKRLTMLYLKRSGDMRAQATK